MEGIEAVVPEIDVSVDTPETTEAPEVETAESAVETPEVETESVDTVEPVEEEATGDGRVLPNEFKQYLKQLQATNPKLAKTLRATFFEAQALKSEFPGGIKEVRTLRDAVGNLGGEAGIQQLMAEKAEWAALDEQFTNGDPAFVANIAESDPGAFAKLIPSALSKFAELDSEGYAHVMAGVMTQLLQDANSPLAKIYQALDGNEQTKVLARELAEWYNGIERLGKTAPIKKVDPERERFQREKQEFEQQKVEGFRKEISNEMKGFNENLIETLLAREFQKGGKNIAAIKKAHPESYREMAMTAHKRIFDAINKDEAWGKQFTAIMNTGDKARALRLGQAKINALAPEAIRQTYRIWNSLGTGKAAQPVVRQSSNIGEVALPKPPKPNEIDHLRTTKEMLWNGKAYLKGKKEVYTFGY